MGKISSKGNRLQDPGRYGQICLETNNHTSSYSGGETISGRVYLNIMTPFPAKQLLLKLKGKESVHIIREEGSQTKHEYEYKDTNEIIKRIVPLCTWYSFISGQYVIPFAFILPEGLSSSFHQEGHRYLANISYSLEAILEPESEVTHPKLKYKQDLIVKKSLVYPRPENERSITTKIKKCGCGDYGANTLGVCFEKSWYTPGEDALALIRFDNSLSKLDNTNIVFALKQKLKLSARHVFLNREFTKIQTKMQGVQKGQAIQREQVSLKLPSMQKGNYNITKRKRMTDFLINLKEDNSVMNSTTKSKLISSEYYLEISCPMNGCCYSTPVSICPIEVCHPDIHPFQIPVPENWNPTTMDYVNISFAPPLPQTTYSHGYFDIEMDSNNMFGHKNIEKDSQYQPFLEYDSKHLGRTTS